MKERKNPTNRDQKYYVMKNQKKKKKKKKKNELIRAKRKKEKKEKKKEQLNNSGEERKKKWSKGATNLTSESLHVCLITKIPLKTELWKLKIAKMCFQFP